MQIIKPILILCFVIVLILVFRQRGRAGLRAGRGSPPCCSACRPSSS